jgi:hypothetical protein
METPMVTIEDMFEEWWLAWRRHYSYAKGMTNIEKGIVKRAFEAGYNRGILNDR